MKSSDRKVHSSQSNGSTNAGQVQKSSEPVDSKGKKSDEDERWDPKNSWDVGDELRRVTNNNNS